MEAELIPYPHTESSFEVRHLLWGFLAEPFDVIIEDLRSEVIGHRSIRIEELHREILYRRFHQMWQSASDIRRFYDGWVREHYAHFFSSARCSQGENDHPNLVSSDDVPASQSASVHRTSSTIIETGVLTHSHTPSGFEVRRSIRASLTAIFDIRIEHLRFVFEEDRESRIESIYRAIWDNEPHQHWDSITDMYRFYEGCIRNRYPHLFSGGQIADDESNRPPADHSGVFTTEAMMRDTTTIQSVDNTLGEDTAGHSIEQPWADLRNEDAGMSLSSIAESFGDGNDVTPVAPIDAIGPHPESYSSGDEVHRRTAADEERDRVLRRGHWVADGPERQTLEDRNERLLFHINELMEIVRSSWHTEDSDTSTSQEERNGSNALLRISQVYPSMSSIPQIRRGGDSGTSSPGEGEGWREGRGDRGGRGGRGRHGRYSQDSVSWIHDLAVSHPNIRASVPLRPPPPVPTRRRAFPRRRRARRPPPDAPNRQEISAYNREVRLRGTPVPPRVRRVARPSWWMPHVDTGVPRSDEEFRFVGATRQGRFATREMPFGRECFENSSLPLSVKC